MSDELNLNTTPELTFEPSAAQAVAAPTLSIWFHLIHAVSLS